MTKKTWRVKEIKNIVTGKSQYMVQYRLYFIWYDAGEVLEDFDRAMRCAQSLNDKRNKKHKPIKGKIIIHEVE